MISGNIEKFNMPLREFTAKVELCNSSSTIPMGKNLAKPRGLLIDGENGLSSTYDEATGIFTINGKATVDYSNVYLTPYIENRHGKRLKFGPGTYSIKVRELGGSFEGYYGMAITDSNGTRYPGLLNKLVLTEESNVSVFVQFRIGKSANNFQITLQIEEGETATEFEPYKQSITITNTTDLNSITIDRVGSNKFYGFGISQKAIAKIRDKDRVYNINKEHLFKFSIDDVAAFPHYYITEVSRNENNNEISVTAYDAINAASAHTVSELGLVSYSIGEFAAACGSLLGVEAAIPALDAFNVYYDSGANFDGTESIRDALNAVAEATQTIYFMNAENKLEFRRLDKDGEAVYTIDKKQYFNLDSKTNRKLVGVCSATELGDNVSAELAAEGETQYVRDNPFYTLRDDVGELVNNALDVVGGLTINQFTCSWRGNYLVEIGDKIALTTKDDTAVYSYLLNDTLTYNGGLSQKSNWEYGEKEQATSNPTSLGEVIKQTYAKVDKANKQVDIVVSQVGDTNSRLTALELNTDSITTTVSNYEKSIDDMSGQLEELTNSVAATMTQSQVQLEIQKAMDNGVEKIETTTGFTFNEQGLNISSSKSDITTTITENGMTVSDESTPVLVANDEGVKAIDLHATTFLIIGNNSRFEDYGNRTACYWIGGQ